MEAYTSVGGTETCVQIKTSKSRTITIYYAGLKQIELYDKTFPIAE